MKYESMTDAVFLQRPNRFIAHCERNGETVVAHVKNTGRCKELLLPGVKVWLQDHRGEAKQRKTDFSLIAVEKQTGQGALLINMDSQAPNKIAEEALLDGRIQLPLDYGEEILSIRREVTFGSSRFDLQVTTNQRIWYVEVKGVTLEDTVDHFRTARFPDAPTERGAKHIHELIAAKEAGYGAAVLFIIQMPNADQFRPNWRTHRDFGFALQQAQKAGVAILAYDCEVKVGEVTAANRVPVELSQTQYALWFSTEEKQALLAELNDDDLQLLSTLHHGKAQEDSTVTQALMKRAARQLGFPQVCIERNEKGAPITNAAGLYVSGSHTKGCCAAVASLYPVGIDAEPIGPLREKVAKRMYSERELEWLDAQPDKDEAFTRLWTLKEAYGKLRGIGLSAAKEVEFREENGQMLCSDPHIMVKTQRQKNYLISIAESDSD